MKATFMLRQWWPGHVSSMPDTWIPKELSDGNRDRGVPRKRWKDQLKGQLTQAGINPKHWEQLAENHAAWWLTTRRAAQDFEITRREAAEERRRWRKEAQEQDPTGPTFLCPWCPRICISRIGLISHLSMPPLAGPSHNWSLDMKKLPLSSPIILWQSCVYHIRDSVFEIMWKQHVSFRIPTLQCILLWRKNLAFRKHQKVLYYSTDGHAVSFND